MTVNVAAFPPKDKEDLDPTSGFGILQFWRRRDGIISVTGNRISNIRDEMFKHNWTKPHLLKTFPSVPNVSSLLFDLRFGQGFAYYFLTLSPCIC